MTGSDVRPSTVEDIAAIQRIARAAWKQTYAGLIAEAAQQTYLDRAYESEWLKKLHGRADVRGFIALEKGQPVGFAMMSLGTPADDPPGAVLRSLYLDPGTQGRGHGRGLLEAVKDAARERGIPLLWVAVHTDLQAARQWYEHHGFAYDGPAEVSIGGQTIREAVYKMSLKPARSASESSR